MPLDTELRDEPEQRRCGRLDLRLSDVHVVEQDLPMEVRCLDRIVVGDADRAHAGPREGDRRGTAQTADAHDEHTRPGEDEATRATAAGMRARMRAGTG